MKMKATFLFLRRKMIIRKDILKAKMVEAER